MRIYRFIINVILSLSLLSCNERTNHNENNITDNRADCIEVENHNENDKQDLCADCTELQGTIPSEYMHSDWMRVYADYILDSIHRNYQSFAICYIDNDDIPELCLYGLGFGDGAIILSQQNGVVSHYRSYWSPQYIERKGFIDDGYSYGGTGGDNIIKLENGEFKVVLRTKMIWKSEYKKDGEDYDNQYFVYFINDNIVDLIFGKDADYDSCKILEDAIKKEYSSKGSSIAILDSPQGVYYTKTLLCELFCEGK